MEKRPIAYQLYSAREEAAQDLAHVLSTLSALGYEGVEFAGFYGMSADDIRALLNRYRLKAVSSHVPLKDIEEDALAVIAYHKAIGCPYIAIPYLSEESRPGRPGFAGVLNTIYRFAALAKANSLQVLYHNHDFEFTKLSGLYALDFLYEAIPQDLLQTELDVCWVKYAGEDPCAYIRKYAGRCPIVHLKDYVGRKTDDAAPYALMGIEEKAADRQAFEFLPLGRGCQDMASIVSSAVESGTEWFVVEQDQSVSLTPLEAAKVSIETLKALGM